MAKKSDCARTLSRPDAEWVQPFLQSQAPLQVSQRFGHQWAWLSEGLQQATTVAAHPKWISWYQLYIDYQIRTGDYGPHFDGGWQDPAVRVMLKARPFKFRQRCSWFVKLVKQILLSNQLAACHNKWRERTQWFSLFIRHQFGWLGRTNDYLQSNNGRWRGCQGRWLEMETFRLASSCLAIEHRNTGWLRNISGSAIRESGKWSFTWDKTASGCADSGRPGAGQGSRWNIIIWLDYPRHRNIWKLLKTNL